MAYVYNSSVLLILPFGFLLHAQSLALYTPALYTSLLQHLRSKPSTFIHLLFPHQSLFDQLPSHHVLSLLTALVITLLLASVKVYRAMPKTIVLHIIALYICFLTFLKPADAVLERGIAYVDNYDPASNKENEWHKRAHGGPYKSDEANSDWLKREANEDGGDVNETPEESHDWLMKRSGTVTFQAAQPFPPSGKSLKMNKRGLIEEWLHPHAMEKRQGCQDAGWVPCSNNRGCCPTSSACCATGCKNNPTDVCCPGYNCKAGYQW